MSSKKSSSKSKEKSSEKKKKEKKPKTPEPEESNEDDYAYEDDFEDYEDDFEDIDEEEIKEEEEQKNTVKPPEKVEQKENKNESYLAERLSKAQLNQAPVRKEVPQARIIPNSIVSMIDNTPYSHYNEEERKSVEQKARERLQKLRGLISIEITKSTVFTDLSSNIFEPFQSLPSNLTHAFTQTGSDTKSEEIQTELFETDSKETQFPHVESSSNNLSKEVTPNDRLRFKNFFFAATQTIREILINDDENTEVEETREKSVMKFSMGYNLFQLGAAAQKCKTSCISVGENDSVLIAFEIFETPAQDLVNKSLIVEFYIHRRRPPKRLFVVESIVTEMILSRSSNVLYVCLSDGTFCAFDLLVSEATFDDFLPWIDSANDIALRRPTFDSSFLATTISDASPLVDLAINPTTNFGEDITTIDQSGTISYWLASRVEKNELQVQLTAVIRPHPILKRQSNSFAISSFNCIKNPVRFFIGTDTGSLYSMYKSDTSQAMPKIYKTEKERNGEITSISSSLFDSSILLVGFSNGSISIYRSTQTSPILNLPKPDNISASRITKVLWSCTNPSAFYSIIGGKTIIYWDLSFQKTPQFVDHRQDNSIILDAKIWKTEKLTYMAFALDNGDAEVHVLETRKPKNSSETLIEVLNRTKTL